MMLLGDLSDTLANITTFVFIGAMIWLLFRPLPNRQTRAQTPDAPVRTEGTPERNQNGHS